MLFLLVCLLASCSGRRDDVDPEEELEAIQLLFRGYREGLPDSWSIERVMEHRTLAAPAEDFGDPRLTHALDTARRRARAVMEQVGVSGDDALAAVRQTFTSRGCPDRTRAGIEACGRVLRELDAFLATLSDRAGVDAHPLPLDGDPPPPIPQPFEAPSLPEEVRPDQMEVWPTQSGAVLLLLGRWRDCSSPYMEACQVELASWIDWDGATESRGLVRPENVFTFSQWAAAPDGTLYGLAPNRFGGSSLLGAYQFGSDTARVIELDEVLGVDTDWLGGNRATDLRTVEGGVAFDLQGQIGGDTSVWRVEGERLLAVEGGRPEARFTQLSWSRRRRLPSSELPECVAHDEDRTRIEFDDGSALAIRCDEGILRALQFDPADAERATSTTRLADDLSDTLKVLRVVGDPQGEVALVTGQTGQRLEVYLSRDGGRTWLSFEGESMAEVFSSPPRPPVVEAPRLTLTGEIPAGEPDLDLERLLANERVQRLDRPEPAVPRGERQRRRQRPALRGSIDREPDGHLTFRPNLAYEAAAVGPAEWALINAESGLWVHELDELARVARVIEPPIGAMTTSSDGRLLAFARMDRDEVLTPGRTLRRATIEIVALPTLEPVARVDFVEPPHRLRFSTGDGQLAAASMTGTVTWVDLEGGRVAYLRTQDPVRDVLPLEDNPAQVAFVDQDDDFTIHDFGTGATIYTDHRRDDLTAVAPASTDGRLLVGGEDRLVVPYEPGPEGWRRLDSATLPDGVYDIACCLDGRAVVGTDALGVYLMNARGQLSDRSLEPILRGFNTGAIRLALTPNQRVIAVRNGQVVIWRPGHPPRFAPAYGMVGGGLFMESDDGAVWIRQTDFEQFTIHYVAYDGPVLDAAMETLMVAELSSADTLSFGENRTVLVGCDRWGETLTAYAIDTSGHLEGPVSVEARVRPYRIVSQAIDAANQRRALLFHNGLVVEVRVDPLQMEVLGRVRRGRYELTYHAENGCWEAASLRWDQQEELCPTL